MIHSALLLAVGVVLTQTGDQPRHALARNHAPRARALPLDAQRLSADTCMPRRPATMRTDLRRDDSAPPRPRHACAVEGRLLRG